MPVVLIAAVTTWGCGKVPGRAGQAVTPAATAAPTKLTPADVRLVVAVRDKSLTRTEEAVAAAERDGGDVMTRVQELSAAERDAALALGFDYRRYAVARDEVSRLLTRQRRRDDAQLLSLELSRARDDLATQREAVRDPANRQFIEAQLASVERQLAELERESVLPPAEAEALAVVRGVRAELAELQGRQEQLQRRVKALLARTQAGSGAAAAR